MEQLHHLSHVTTGPAARYQSVEKTIPGFFNGLLVKGTSANLTIFLALPEPAKFGGTSLCRTCPFFNGLIIAFRMSTSGASFTVFRRIWHF
jgi:hypothetical protein